MKNFIKFIVAMFLAFLPGIIGVTFTPHGGSDAWYNALNKSVLTPDGWVFGVAWTVLYALIGIALYMIMRSAPRVQRGKSAAYASFAVQMVLNALWTYLFFGLHVVAPAFIVIVALIVVTMLMMRAFAKIHRRAGYFIVPYLLWLLFAAYLNGAILFLN